VKAGDVIYVPAGTVHAIGAGISLLEVQQNIDVTYRLYDYGRPRELHLDEGMKVAKPLPYPDEFATRAGESGNRALISVPAFTLLCVEGPCEEAEKLAQRDRWAIPLEGLATSGNAPAAAGECLFLPAGTPLEVKPGSKVLIAAPGPLS
jgi:mannose-6-phosphate isomerase